MQGRHSRRDDGLKGKLLNFFEDVWSRNVEYLMTYGHFWHGRIRATKVKFIRYIVVI